MPALENIEARLSKDPEWNREFDQNREKARAVAEGIPLLHVTSDQALLGALLSLPHSAWIRRSPRTERAEQALGWPSGPRTYLYAGRACPDFGGLAIAFGADCEASKRGAARPFDTGGLLFGHIQTSLPQNTPDALRDFVIQSTIDIAVWRERFSLYLAAYFSPLHSYWTSGPCRSDPEYIFLNDSNTWRSWVFEIVLESTQDFSRPAAWCGSPDCINLLRSMIVNSAPPFGPPRDSLSEFLAKELILGEGQDYIEAIESWALSKAGL